MGEIRIRSSEYYLLYSPGISNFKLTVDHANNRAEYTSLGLHGYCFNKLTETVRKEVEKCAEIWAYASIIQQVKGS